MKFWVKFACVVALVLVCTGFACADDSEVDEWGVLQLKKYLRASTEYLERYMTTHSRCHREELVDNDAKLDVKDGRTFSFRDFYRNYATKKRPVLIKNYMQRMFPSYNVTTEYIRETCGEKQVWVQRANPKAKRWGGLIGGEDVQLKDFIDGKEHSNLYLHDWPLPRNCPDLIKDYYVPKYFATDFVHRIPSNIHSQHSTTSAWPSLFIGRAGTFSALHVDTFGSNFWMLLLEGKKHWRFFPNEDRPLLYESPDTQSFEFDAFNPDFQKFPLAAFARSFDVILTPGDLLFVPGGMPHQVRNPEYSVAMSANYVDSSNLALVAEELDISGQAGYTGSANLLKELLLVKPDIDLDGQQDMHYWREFNHQTPPREEEDNNDSKDDKGEDASEDDEENNGEDNNEEESEDLPDDVEVESD